MELAAETNTTDGNNDQNLTSTITSTISSTVGSTIESSKLSNINTSAGGSISGEGNSAMNIINNNGGGLNRKPLPNFAIDKPQPPTPSEQQQQQQQQQQHQQQ